MNGIYSEISLRRYSISTYTNTNQVDNTPGNLSESKKSSANYISVIRVGFRQYSNPNINSSSTLSLDNRLTLMDQQDALIYGDILFYPNPFRLNSGAILTYVLNNPANINVQIYDMFGHRVYQRTILKGMDGALMGTNRLRFDKSVFNYFDVPAGVYFIFLFDDQNKLIGKSKFAVVP
ncbi:MAG: T9SS type A sorting domain-containing protein [Candidatus Margulisiibacteriota bacterium]